MQTSSVAPGRRVDSVLDLITNPQQWLVIGLPVVALLVIIGWRRPTLLLLAALGTFAVGPTWLLAGRVPDPMLPWLAPAQLGLLSAALLANMAAYGGRFQVRNWPALVVLLMLATTLILPGPDGAPAIAPMASTALALALPWSVLHVALEQHTRQRLALLIGLLPLLSVAIGAGLHTRDLHPVHLGTGLVDFELQGAAAPGWLGLLAFAGFAVAGQEYLRTRQKRFAVLALVDLGLALLSGSQMAVFACVVVALLQALLSADSRARLGRLRLVLLTGAAVVASLAVLLLPSIRQRLAGGEVAPTPHNHDGWTSAFGDWLQAPILGQGLGATLAGGLTDPVPGLYLRLVAETGAVGLLLFAAAVVLWLRDLLSEVRSSDRGFTLALLMALAIHAITDDVLVMAPTVVLFVYLDAVVKRQRYPSAEGPPSDRSVGRAAARDALAVARARAGGRDPAASAEPGLGPIEAALRRAGPVNGDPAMVGAGYAPGESLLADPRTPAAASPYPGLPAAAQIAPVSGAAERLAAAAQAQLDTGDLAAARATLARASAAGRSHPAIEAVQAAVDLTEHAARLPELEALLHRLEANEDDQAARLDLAVAMFQLGQVDEAVNLLLISIRKDRSWQDQAARRQLLGFFAALGPTHATTITGRRKLAAVLFS